MIQLSVQKGVQYEHDYLNAHARYVWACQAWYAKPTVRSFLRMMKLRNETSYYYTRLSRFRRHMALVARYN